MLNIECNQRLLLQTSFKPQKASITNAMNLDDTIAITDDEEHHYSSACHFIGLSGRIC